MGGTNPARAPAVARRYTNTFYLSRVCSCGHPNLLIRRLCRMCEQPQHLMVDLSR